MFIMSFVEESRIDLFYHRYTVYFQISESFRRFGLGDSDTSVFIVLLNDQGHQTLSQLRSLIQGTEVSTDDIHSLADVDAIKRWVDWGFLYVR